MTGDPIVPILLFGGSAFSAICSFKAFLSRHDEEIPREAQTSVFLIDGIEYAVYYHLSEGHPSVPLIERAIRRSAKTDLEGELQKQFPFAGMLLVRAVPIPTDAEPKEERRSLSEHLGGKFKENIEAAKAVAAIAGIEPNIQGRVQRRAGEIIDDLFSNPDSA
jgi:hypothetical protein